MPLAPRPARVRLGLSDERHSVTMKTHRSTLIPRFGVPAAVLLLTLGGTARPAERPALKEAYKDHFQVGTAVSRTLVTGTAVRTRYGSRTEEQVREDRALVLQQFNQICPENDLKWALIHPEQGPDGYAWAPADAFVDFGLRHGMSMVGHTLVWHSQTPNWVFQGTLPAPEEASPSGDGPGPGFRRFRFTGPRASRQELLERMRDHIHTVVGRYRGKIQAWDVVNEAVADRGDTLLRDSLWVQIIGPDFIAKAFEFAHEADPEAILRYNDYGLEDPVKRGKVIALIRSLQEQGVPVMAIGTQAHLNVSTASFESMDRALTELDALGLPIHVTELDINSAQGGQRGTGADVAENAATTRGGLVEEADQRLAEAYAGVFRAFLKHRASVQVVTFWGANDAVSWRARGAPLLFDGNNQPKPALDAVLRVAAEALPDPVEP